ncbi:MAG TPA: metal-dependent hydrolase, partial [Agitococcus sp.]|nr:metal-dependent hydrolase [Agitococcus sp.]
MTAAINPSLTQQTANHHHDLKVRQMDFGLKDIPEFWYDNDPFKTLLLSALSGGFPAGEHFFIHSIRHFQEQIKDPELRQAVRAFIGQEAHHSKEHDVLNDLMIKHGYSIDRIDRNVAFAMKWYKTYLSPARQ